MDEGEIVRLLSANCHSGRKPYVVFSDFLDMTEAALDAMPRHLENARDHGRPADDTPEVADLWKRLRDEYKTEDFQRFKSAFHILSALSVDRAQGWGNDTSNEKTLDVIGRTYEMFQQANPFSGQYFTPWALALTMARMLANGGGESIEGALRRMGLDALRKMRDVDPIAAALCDSAVTVATLDESLFVTHVVPLMSAYVDPVTYNDPACGSGVMLLAGAVCWPRWACDWGWVRFTGQDTDRQCVQMARINLMLYGLNGFSLRLRMAAGGASPHVVHAEQSISPAGPVVGPGGGDGNRVSARFDGAKNAEMSIRYQQSTLFDEGGNHE